MMLLVLFLDEEMQRKSTGETSGNVLTMESRGRQKERGRSQVIVASLEREDLSPDLEK